MNNNHLKKIFFVTTRSPPATLPREGGRKGIPHLGTPLPLRLRGGRACRVAGTAQDPAHGGASRGARVRDGGRGRGASVGAAVAKASLREEFDTLKARFERLSADMSGRAAPCSRPCRCCWSCRWQCSWKSAGQRTAPTPVYPPPTAKDETVVAHPGAKGKGPSQR